MTVHERYIQIIKELKPSGRILKTDCFNEVRTDYPIMPLLKGDITLIDTDESLTKVLKNAINGDIRHTNFKDNEFDWIIDFSTIDHVLEYNEVIEEYKRILKNNGKLLIVAWLWRDKRVDPKPDEFGGVQFYFPYNDFKKHLFNILDEEQLDNFQNKYLVKFLCQKHIL